MISLDTGLWQRGPSASFSPLSLSPALWFDASDSTTLFQSNGGSAAAADGDPVGYWMDKSGNNLHLSQTSGTNKPVLKTSVKNGRNGIQFNGTSSFLNMTSYTHGTAITSFCVVNRLAASAWFFACSDSGATDFPWLWNSSNKLTTWYSLRTFTSTNTYSSTGSYLLRSSYTSNADQAVWLNGSSVGGSLSGSTGGVPAWTLFGKGSSIFSNGQILEQIIYPASLSAGNIALVESYLNAKWAVY